MNSNNVVTFPRQYGGPHQEQITTEDVVRNVENMKYYHIQETIATIAPILFNNLDVAGFDLTDEETADIKDGAFILEAIKSMMCKYYGLYHPFQLISENVFLQDEDDYESLRIVDSINIELKNNQSN